MKKCFISGLFGPLLILFLLVLACGLDPTQLFPEQTSVPPPPSVASRAISQDFRKNLLWHKGSIYIRHLSLPSPELVTGRGYVALVNFLGGPSNAGYQIEVLDAYIGHTAWQSDRFSDYEDMAIVRDRAFVLLNEGKLLNIYDIKGDSKPLHSLDNYFKPGTTFYLFPISDDKIYLYYVQGEVYTLHLIDLEGREVSSPRMVQVPHWLSRLFLFDQPFFLVTGDEYIGGDFETGEELWRIPAFGRIDSWPVLRDNILYLSAGDGRRYALQALDITSGRKLWQTEKNFGSNIVWHQDGLYALRNDAVLAKIDPTTGQIVEEIPFTPNSIDAGFSAYWLASDGDRLFVYFGDSQELFALEI